MPYPLPESIVNGVTAGHNAHALDLHRRYNRTSSEKTRIFSPFDYGAVGDLVADDAPAINAAIQAALDAGGGRVGPLGKHKCLSKIVWKKNVSLFGVGYGGSLLHFPTDLGAGVAAVGYDPADVGGGVAAGTMRDINIQGPGSLVLSPGTQSSNMDGVRLAPHCDMFNVRTIGFRAGIVISADHVHLYNCRSEFNYYAVEFPAVLAAPSAIGSQSFWGCIFNYNNFASVALSSQNVADLCVWDGCHFGWGPYGLYRADIGGVGTATGFSSNVFDACVWEYCGNAAILDESTGSGSDSVVDCDFNRCTYSGSSHANYRIPSRSHAACFDVRGMRNNHFREATLPFRVPPDGTTTFKVSEVCTGITDYRPVSGVSGSMPTAAGAYIQQSAPYEADGFNLDTGRYRAYARTTTAGTTNIFRGELLGYAGANLVQRLTATTNFAGVALNDAGASEVVMVAPPGSLVPVLCEPVIGGSAIRPVVGREWHGDDTGTGPVIGYAATGGGAAGGSLVTVGTRSP